MLLFALSRLLVARHCSADLRWMSNDGQPLRNPKRYLAHPKQLTCTSALLCLHSEFYFELFGCLGSAESFIVLWSFVSPVYPEQDEIWRAVTKLRIDRVL